MSKKHIVKTLRKISGHLNLLTKHTTNYARLFNVYLNTIEESNETQKKQLEVAIPVMTDFLKSASDHLLSSNYKIKYEALLEEMEVNQIIIDDMQMNLSNLKNQYNGALNILDAKDKEINELKKILKDLNFDIDE